MTQIIKTLTTEFSLEPCPDNCVELTQVDTLSTQKNNKVLIQTYLTAKPYHTRTTPVVCKVDTGAEVNVIPKRHCELTIPNPKQRKLNSPSVKITAYGGYEINTCQLLCTIEAMLNLWKSMLLVQKALPC